MELDLQQRAIKYLHVIYNAKGKACAKIFALTSIYSSEVEYFDDSTEFEIDTLNLHK